ncbi:hypothetical protein FQZ97_1076220 [compost metagenome]
MGGAVGVVLDAFDLGRDAVLGATEVDHAVVVLMTTALVANRDVTVVVATGLLELWFQQRCITFTFVEVVTRDLHHAATAW